MVARIFRPAKTAMQSGRGKMKNWTLVFDRESAREIEPLMGYTSSSDMNAQIKLVFDTCDAAESYAKRNGLAYRVEQPQERTEKKVSYPDNFRFDRKVPWTH